MNKKPKLSKLTNRELVESAFKQIEKETNLHIVDVEFEDCYFSRSGRGGPRHYGYAGGGGD